MSIVKQMLKTAFPQVVHAWRIKRLSEREQEIKLLPLICDSSKLSIDVGGNLGLYTHHLRKLSRGVVVFEPIPQLQAHLKQRYPDVTIEGFALSDEAGTAQLRMPSDNYSWATIADENDLKLAEVPLTSIDVEIRTLDSFGFENVGLIKIDVEGHEESVLRGARRLLAEQMPSLVIEVEERHNPGSVQRVLTYLTQLGYMGFFFYENELVDAGHFRLERDQPLSNVGSAGKIGRYINNFIFVSANSANKLRDRVRQIR